MNDPHTWFCYESGSWYGLKRGDGVRRGVPEGTREQWDEVVAAIRTGGEFYSKRLAYFPERGIFSPRNTNRDEDAFRTDDADLIVYLLDHPQEWREDGLSDHHPAMDYLASRGAP